MVIGCQQSIAYRWYYYNRPSYLLGRPNHALSSNDQFISYCSYATPPFPIINNKTLSPFSHSVKMSPTRGLCLFNVHPELSRVRDLLCSFYRYSDAWFWKFPTRMAMHAKRIIQLNDMQMRFWIRRPEDVERRSGWRKKRKTQSGALPPLFIKYHHVPLPCFFFHHLSFPSEIYLLAIISYSLIAISTNKIRARASPPQ